MKITISGTPGTGKTEVSRFVAKKLNYTLVDINAFAKKNHLITGTDTVRNSQIIDETKLKEKSTSIKDNTIIEGHLAHYCTADIAIILRTDPKILRERLKKRQWPKKKIDENIEAEKLDIILQESASQNKNTYEIDTTAKTAEKTADMIIDMIKDEKTRKEHRPGKISWERYI